MTSLLLAALVAWSIYSQWDRFPLRSSQFRAKNDADSGDHVEYLLGYMREHGVTLAQLAEAQAHYAAAPPQPKREAGDIAMRLFSWLGGIFVFAGIGVYIGTFWPSMPPAMRVFVTLGLGLALSLLSVIAMKEGKYPKLILPLILLAALTETCGWFVWLYEYFPHHNDPRKAELFVCGVMAFQQGLVLRFFPRNSLVFTALAFFYAFLAIGLDMAGMREDYIMLVLGGSLLCVADALGKTRFRALSILGYLFAAFWFNCGLLQYLESFTEWPQAVLLTGMSLCSFAYGLREAGIRRLPGLGFFVGSVMFYCGLFEYVRHTPFELIYLGVTISMLYGCVVLESRALLLTSVLALLGFLGYYTSEYFANSLGWPIALILLGVAFFAVSAVAVQIKRKYRL